MFNTNGFSASHTLVFFGFVINSIVFDTALGLALRTNYLVRRIVVIVHVLQKLLNQVRRHKSYIYFWVYNALQAVGGIVPVESVELRDNPATVLAFDFLWKQSAVL